MMHEVGVLGKFLPEFGRLTGMVQHEFFHIYTTDEHTIQCLEHLDLVWEEEGGFHRHYSQLFQDLEHPHILYLALLLHDAGKSNKKNRSHSDIGQDLAVRVGSGCSCPKTINPFWHSWWSITSSWLKYPKEGIWKVTKRSWLLHSWREM